MYSTKRKRLDKEWNSQGICLEKHGRRDVMLKPAISPNYTPQFSENFLLIIFNFCVYFNSTWTKYDTNKQILIDLWQKYFKLKLKQSLINKSKFYVLC